MPPKSKSKSSAASKKLVSKNKNAVAKQPTEELSDSSEDEAKWDLDEATNPLVRIEMISCTIFFVKYPRINTL